MLIVVEGCVGAGKSTVAKELAAYRNSGLILEAFETNPFLRAFYEDPAGNALETEFAFLLLHYHQLKEHSAEMEKSEMIADFHLGKDLLYAAMNLTDPPIERAFRNLHDLLAERTQREGLMVCLSASTELVLERISQRNRDFETTSDSAYFPRLNTVYVNFFKRYAGRKIHVSMDEWNFVEDPELVGRLSRLIDEELKS